MIAVSLLLVLAVAKLAMVLGRPVAFSAWSPLAYLWQDALVCLVFGAAVFLAGTSHASARVTRVIYWSIAIYAAVNIPVGRVLSTALTWPMLRAARGPLADSLLLYLTWTNALLMMSALAAAAVIPRLLRLLPARLPHVAAACALPIIALGPSASARVDTLGLERNVLVALVRSALPQVRSRPAEADWRHSRFNDARLDDLSRLRGGARGRNLVLISLESTAAQYLSPGEGQDEVEEDVMPALTALSKHAVVFDNAYAAYPESIKGLFSILCSTFPAFDLPPETYGAVPCHSLPALLQGAGYRTGLFHSGRFAYLGMESIIRNRGYETLEDAGHIGGNHRSSFGVDEPATVDRMLAWIDSLPRERPFFLTYLPIAGHHPYESPERGVFTEDEEFGRYLNALRYGDRSLGALVQGLRDRGLDGNTLWIILGDHGEAFGQHAGNYGHTFFLYDENVRVPFVIAAPGVTEGHTRVGRVVSLVDTAPTILDLLGLPIPGGYQGRSMLESVPGMALFFTDYSRPLVGLRDGRWKFVYELDTARGRLFDMERDPAETTDVSAQMEGRAAWYAERLRSWSAAQKSRLLGGAAK